jgi:hypothetical protein
MEDETADVGLCPVDGQNCSSWDKEDKETRIVSMGTYSVDGLRFRLGDGSERHMDGHSFHGEPSILTPAGSPGRL